MTRTLIVPAAGLGTRLRSDVPKLITPVAGRPMIAYVLARFDAFCDRFVLVIHPSARASVEATLRDAPQSIVLAEQPHATGMLDAILLAADAVRAAGPDRVWICWCDQVLLSAGTLQRMAALELETPPPAAVVPTARVPDPYIHFDRDAAGRLTAVRQRREGDLMPGIGETDAGVFGLSEHSYDEQLAEYARQAVVGRITAERNFLPFLPWLATRETVVTVPVANAFEARGINTPDDLAFAELHLRAGDPRGSLST